MTLDEFINAGAAFQRRLDDDSPDPAPGLVASGITRDVIQARHDMLAQIDLQKCVISGIQRQFLERVLALMP